MEKSSQQFLANGLLWLCVAIGFGSILVSRLKYFGIAGGNDEAMYMYLGKMAAMGKAPYVDYYEMKPPMMFVNYAITGIVFGFNFFGSHLMSIILLFANTFLFFRFASHLTSKTSATYGSIIFGLLCSSVILFGPYLQLEHFVVFYILLSINIIIKYRTNRGLLIGGALFACAVLTKQTAALFLPVLISVYFTSYDEGTLASRIKKGLPIAYGGIFFSLLLLGIVVAWVGFKPITYWLYSYPAEYAGRNSIETGISTFKSFGSGIYRVNTVPVLFIGIAFVVSFFHPNKVAKVLLIALLVSGILAIIPGYRFYPQYWILLLPAAGLAVAIAMDYLLLKDNKVKVALLILIIVSTHIAIAKEYLFPNKPSEVIETVLSGQYFGLLEQAAQEAKKKINKNDKLLVLGGIPQMYLYLNKVAPTRHIWAPMLALNTKENVVMQEELINDLKTSKPEFVFFSYAMYHWTLIEGSSNNVYSSSFRYITNNYTKVLLLDFATGKMYRDQEAQQQQERENVLVLYKKL